MLRRALAIDEQILGPTHPRIARHLGDLAKVLHSVRRAQEAHSLLDRALDILGAGGREPQDMLLSSDLATVYANRGIVHTDLGDLDAAIADYDAAIELGKALASALSSQWPPAMRNDLATGYLNRGTAYGNCGRHKDAALDFERAIEIAQPLVNAYPQMPDWRGTLEQAEQNLALARREAARDAAD